MARVTVEDCAEVVPSRFELVVLAAQRAKIISSGGEAAVERDNDKDPVIALREVAAGKLDVEKLRELVIQNCQERVSVDDYGVEKVATVDGEGSEEVVEEISMLQQDVLAGDSEGEIDSVYSQQDVDVVD